ncbi:hypothetical protein BC828DRAFT_419003 [Blastocladiella britannica]|nr:hypothetical protein BC828DRAFT_419003 [Blastocladiella britannica]
MTDMLPSRASLELLRPGRHLHGARCHSDQEDDTAWHWLECETTQDNVAEACASARSAIFAMLADEGGLSAPARGAAVLVVDHLLSANNLCRFAAGVVLPGDVSLYRTAVAPFFPRHRVRTPARTIGHAVALLLSRLCAMVWGCHIECLKAANEAEGLTEDENARAATGLRLSRNHLHRNDHARTSNRPAVGGQCPQCGPSTPGMTCLRVGYSNSMPTVAPGLGAPTDLVPASGESRLAGCAPSVSTGSEPCLTGRAPPAPMGDEFRLVRQRNQHHDVNKGNTYIVGINAVEATNHSATAANTVGTMIMTALIKRGIEARYNGKVTLNDAQPIILTHCRQNGQEDPATAKPHTVHDLTRNAANAMFYAAVITNLPGMADPAFLQPILDSKYPGKVARIEARVFRAIPAASVVFNDMDTYTHFVASTTMTIGSHRPHIFADFDTAEREYEADRARTLYAHNIPRHLFLMDLLCIAWQMFANVWTVYMMPTWYDANKYHSTVGIRFVLMEAHDVAMELVTGQAAGIWKAISPHMILTQIPNTHACFNCSSMGHMLANCPNPRPACQQHPRIATAPCASPVAAHPVAVSHSAPSAMHCSTTTVVGATWAQAVNGHAPAPAPACPTPATMHTAAPAWTTTAPKVYTPGLVNIMTKAGGMMLEEIMKEVWNGNIQAAQDAQHAYNTFMEQMGLGKSMGDMALMLAGIPTTPPTVTAQVQKSACQPPCAAAAKTTAPHIRLHQKSATTSDHPVTTNGSGEAQAPKRLCHANQAGTITMSLATLQAAIGPDATRLAEEAARQTARGVAATETVIIMEDGNKEGENADCMETDDVPLMTTTATAAAAATASNSTTTTTANTASIALTAE